MASAEFKFEKLSASNYSTWKTVIKSHLIGKELWDYIESVKNESDEDAIHNEKAKAIIYLAMETPQIAATGVCETAHDLWVKIKENHEGALSNLRSTSLAEFLGIKYRKGESLISYAGRYENILGRLESTGQKVDETTKMWAFSNSLPQHMKSTVHMFTMAQPNGLVTELISQLKIQYHIDRQESDRQAAAYHTQEAPENRLHNKQQRGGPQRKQFGSQNEPGKQQPSCNYCKKPGHFWKECRKLKFDNERKKRFGQMNQQRQQQATHQRPQNIQRTQQPNQTTSRSGAFNANAHEFSEGKFTWIVDSGASCHMTPHRDYLTCYEEFEEPRPITLGDGKRVEAIGHGKMPFRCDSFNGELQHVLWVPRMKENLFSIGKAMEHNCSVEFCNENSTVSFYRNKQLVLQGHRKPNQLYFLLHLEPLADNCGTLCAPDECAFVGATLETWHKRLGHCSLETVKAMLKTGAVEGMRVATSCQPNCTACTMSKICRAHHPLRSEIKATEQSAVLHIDTVGPMKTASIGGSRYFVLATEEYSGYKLFETMSSKAAIPDTVKRMINRAELESGRQVKAILTDNGSEFINNDLERFLDKRGTVHFYSATYTPEQNGRAERANRTVLDGIRTLLADSKLPERFWAEALNTFVYTSNRLTSKSNPNQTHYELFRGTKPNISNLRVFGQQAIIREPNSTRDGKLAPRGEKVTFVGYTERYNTFRFFISTPHEQVIESCDVRFIESPENPPMESQDNLVTILDEVGSDKSQGIAVPDDSSSQTETEIDENFADALNGSDSTAQESESESDSSSSSEDLSEDANPPERRVTRSLAKAIKSEQQVRSAPAQDSAQIGAMFTLDNEPRTLKDAKESDEWSQWRKAMDEEISALEKNKTWILVDRPAGVKPIKNKWVYKLKLNPDGTIERFKARLVAKGYTQIENIDYKETYAPVASMNTIRLLLAVANQESMHIIQFDIKTAFLYGDLDETLYMEQPENYVKDPDKVCKLVKSLYGLKQAPRQWNKKFDQFLKLFKLQQSCVDRCVYYSDDRSLILAIYVDDGLAVGREKKKLSELMDYLKANFELKSMEAECYLGLEIKRDLKAKTLDITQVRYIEKMLSKFNMADCNTVSTPEQVGAGFDESEPLPTDNQFKELLGSLLYLTTCSRPDIAHAVSIASRTSQPTQAHWMALKRILRYLKGTKDLGVRFRWENSNELIGYSDADYANDAATRKSTTGLCIFFGGGPIAWKCQRQPIITLSTTEAEYVAGCELVKEILPIREQLIELGQINDKQPAQVYIDNQSTVRIASNENGQKRTKHIDIREKWLTEQAQKKKITISHISGEEQVADILTKPLYRSKFISNRSKLLTQITSVMAIMAVCLPWTDARELVLTDPLTTVPSDYAFVKGDTRYRLTNVFVNPCETLFKYGNTMTVTERAIKSCFSLYRDKHMLQLANCRKMPTIGAEFNIATSSYDCSDVNGSDHQQGKCEVIRRDSKPSFSPELELARTQEAWARHKKKVQSLPSINRSKRAIPFLAYGASVLIASIFTGATIKTYSMGKINERNLEMVSNITDSHSQIMKEAIEFYDQYRESVEAIQNWAQEVEERLGDYDLAIGSDNTSRGKRAKLVKSYIQWFNNQEKLLVEINQAAGKKKVPAALHKMLNSTQGIDRAANWSTLFDCSYRLENRSMVLTLDFLLPIIDEDIEILSVVPMSLYSTNNSTSKRTDDSDGPEICWENYAGPAHVIHNKTNDCYMGLNEGQVYKNAVRSQLCLDPRNELHDPVNRSTLWMQQGCTKEVPKIDQRIQIHEIDGVHKIYCYPHQIEIEGEKHPCPNSAFILEAHANYKIGNITHFGAYIDASITREMKTGNFSGEPRLFLRRKRSPIEHSEATTAASQPSAEMAKPTEKPLVEQKLSISTTLRNITGRMNATLSRIKEAVGRLPDSIHLNTTSLGEVLDAPFELMSDGYKWIKEMIQSLGLSFNLLTICAIVILVVPMIELVLVVVKIAKIPANIWISSAKRVSNHFSSMPHVATSSVSSVFKKKRRRFNDVTKMA